MLKQFKFSVVLFLSVVGGIVASTVPVQAAIAQNQTIKVSGQIVDQDNEPLIGATVQVKGASTGTVTDLDGNFSLDAPANAVLVVSYVGYQDQEIAVQGRAILGTIQLESDNQVLEQVVVVGYGTQKKADLTGSVSVVNADEMKRVSNSNISTMLEGKVAGVQITSDGQPGADPAVRIRGIGSFGSTAPLYVIDGVPMGTTIRDFSPNDIATIQVLKDASAGAIYGSRASNGVIIITTKKGSKSGKIRLAYNGNVSASTIKNRLEVMDGNEYRSFINNLYGEGSDQASHLGSANTDWQDQIYRTAISTDHNLTATGNIAGMPFRASVGYTNQKGIIKTSDFERYTASVNFSPSFMEDHLNFNVNAKGMVAKNRYADGGVVGSALTYDPTQPIYNNDPSYVTSFGGFQQWTSTNAFGDPTWPLAFNSLAQANPVATLEFQNNRATSKSLIGNIELDYKFHGFEDLRFHANGGMDLSTGKQNNDIDPRSASNNYYGYTGVDKTDKYNLLFSSYLQYAKEFTENHNFDIMAGYEWQHFHREGTNQGWGWIPGTNSDPALQNTKYNEVNREWAAESYLVSFYSRLNYTLLQRYMLTATFRADGSSKFNKDNRWGYFPSVALAWKINEEAFVKDIDWISDWKLRLGYGLTGQQEGIGEYSYFASYVANREHAFYPIIGDGTTSRPNAYNDNLTWEKTTTWNAGMDFGILNGRFTAALDFYHRNTKDLLQSVPVAAGSNFKNTVMANVGSLKNTGLEFSIGGKVIQARDFMWDVQYNVTWNKNKITSMTVGEAAPGYYLPTGYIAGGTGNSVQAQAVGHPAYSFLVYQQVYDENGKAIENEYVDRNGDGIISDLDRYFYKKPAADVLMGLSSKMIWKNWDFSFSLRASLNNYVFNNVESNNSNQGKAAVYAQSGFFSNFVTRHLDKGFQGVGNYFMSDMFVQNASFLKVDNITLGYSFDNLFKRGINGRVYATVQNVLTITKYKGLDPEVGGGIDNNFYPRPLVSMLGLSLNF